MSYRRPHLMGDFVIGGITPEEFCSIASGYNDRQEARQRARGILPFKADDVKDKFKVTINVYSHFAPKDISVKTEDGCLVVECKHEEKKDQDDIIVSRQFLTRYKLPDHFLPAEEVNVEKKLNARGGRGILTVVATKKILDTTRKAEEMKSKAHAAAKTDEVAPIAQEEEVALEANAVVKETEGPSIADTDDNGEEVVSIGHAAVKEEKPRMAGGLMKN